MCNILAALICLITAIRIADACLKRGHAYGDPTLLRSFSRSGSQISWCYNWDSTAVGYPNRFEYVPMLWGLNIRHTAKWFDNAQRALNASSCHLLSFNEPDRHDQSNLSPKDAAIGYTRYMQPFADTASLGAPAVSNGPGGLEWLSDFLNECTSCQIDFVPIHWYDSAGNIDYFYSYIQKARGVAGDRPLWITEVSSKMNSTNVK